MRHRIVQGWAMPSHGLQVKRESGDVEKNQEVELILKYGSVRGTDKIRSDKPHDKPPAHRTKTEMGKEDFIGVILIIYGAILISASF